jgi:hypothetical protein
MCMHARIALAVVNFITCSRVAMARNVNEI